MHRRALRDKRETEIEEVGEENRQQTDMARDTCKRTTDRAVDWV
jgi:hypothetical protein